MTIINFHDEICPVCKNEFRELILLSTNVSGFSDLDTRPPEMERSTMHTWTHECPHCGYVSNDFSEKTNITEEFVQSDGYQSCNGITFKSNQAKIFYREYLIGENENDKEKEFFALL